MPNTSPNNDIAAHEEEIRTSIFEALASPLQELQDVLEKYKAKDTNDTDLLGRLNTLLDTLSKVVGIEQIGKVGQIVSFNPEEHRSGDKNLSTGTKARILVPGYRLKNSHKAVITAVVTKGVK